MSLTLLSHVSRPDSPARSRRGLLEGLSGLAPAELFNELQSDLPSDVEKSAGVENGLIDFKRMSFDKYRRLVALVKEAAQRDARGEAMPKGEAGDQ